MVPNLVFCLLPPPLRGVGVEFAGACAAVHALNIASIDSFVKAVSLVLIDAGIRPGAEDATLLAPFA